MKSILAVALSLCLAACAAANLRALQGTWKATSGMIAGKALPESLRQKMVLIVKGDTFDYDEGAGHDLGTLKEIPHTSPHAIDIIGTKGPNQGRKIPAIYKIEGRHLILHYGLDGHRPTSFRQKGKPVTFLMRFERAQ